MQETGTAPPAVDRFVGRLGARRIVERSPGLGWMLLEFFPVMIWSRVTGGISMEATFYLVGFLTALGADPRDRSWLLLLHGAAVALHAVVVLRRRLDPQRSDPKAWCVRNTLLGRLCWTAALAWPFAAGAAGLSGPWLLGGLYLGIFAGQFFHFLGVSAWTTWTQDIVPGDQRGPFLAWRNISGFLIFALVSALIGWCWPELPPGEPAPLESYGWLFAAVSVPCLLSTLWLARAPPLSHTTLGLTRELPPLRRALRDKAPYWRYLAWNAGHCLAIAGTSLYLPDLIRRAGAGESLYASLEAGARIPVMLAGLFLGGIALRRFGSRPLLLATSACLIAGLGGHLALRPDNLAWLLPLAMVAEGLGIGLQGIVWITRLYEVSPRGDPRFPALLIGSGALIMCAASLAMGWFIPRIEAAAPALPVSWYLVAGALTVRVLITPLLLDGRQIEKIVGP